MLPILHLIILIAGHAGKMHILNTTGTIQQFFFFVCFAYEYKPYTLTAIQLSTYRPYCLFLFTLMKLLMHAISIFD